jgi:hypothetical protein
MANRGLSFPEVCRLIGDFFGVNLETDFASTSRHKADAKRVASTPEQKPPPMNDFGWTQAVRKFDPGQQQHLAGERALSTHTFAWLTDRGEIGLLVAYGKLCVAFPVRSPNGQVIGAHYRWPERNGEGQHNWYYTPEGIKIGPLLLGRLATARKVFFFESQWDGIALIDRLNLHDQIDAGEVAVVCTRGAQFGNRLAGLRLAEPCDAYVFPQNDVAGERWLDSIVAGLAREVRVVRTPRKFKDLNDWTRDGAQKTDLMSAIEAAEIRNPKTTRPYGFSRFSEAPKSQKTGVRSRGCVPGEIGEIGEIASGNPKIEWETSPNSTISPGAPPQKAIFPPDSILADYHNLAVTLTEGAECYIIGSILPVCAALMGQAVWLPWMAQSLHPNLFTMLAGKPGDRKTSTIDLAESIAEKSLPRAAFLPKAFSPETLFDEYDVQSGGRSDKIWICDDANATLADWQKSSTGERNAARFLGLYDCKGLSENYRRNRQKGQPKEAQQRFIAHTSTSVVFGATFNICTFRNQATRAGMQRRFLYYVAEGHGRVILYPPSCEDKLEGLADGFSSLGLLAGKFSLSKDALKLFEDFQKNNRDQMNQSDPLDEALLSRLSSSPTHVLKVAMIFEACRSVRAGRANMEIQESTLQYAIAHVEECLSATTKLDLIARRIYIANDAEVLLAEIRYDFAALNRNGSIVLSRTQLTSKYAAHGTRGRGLNVQDIYLRLIPYLIGRGDAQALPKEGKLERWAIPGRELKMCEA